MTRVLFCLLGLWLAVPALAQQPAYQTLPTPQRTDDPSRVEVLDFFWYGCGHCYTLHPTTKAWAATLGDDVQYRKMPAVFSDTWGRHAQIFFTAQALGIEPQATELVFNAIHQKRQRLIAEAEIAALFEPLGVDKAAFTKAFNSFAVKTQVTQAAELSRRYRLEGVPALVVNGKHLTGPSFVSDNRQLMGVLDGLIAKERATLSAPVAAPAETAPAAE